jgi:hypothetical protein
VGVRSDEVVESADLVQSPALLDDAEDGIDRHHQQDDRRVDEVTGDDSEHRRCQQHKNQGVVQLPGDRAPERRRRVHLDVVRTVPNESGGGGARVQAGRRDDSLVIHHLRG